MNKMNMVFNTSIVCVGLLSTTALTVNAADIDLYRVNENANFSVNVRKNKNEDETNKIGELFKDEIIEVIGKEDNWYKIKYGKKEGYVHSKYLSKCTETYIVNANIKANLRKEPSKNASEITQIPRGELVEVYSFETYWAKVKYGNYIGYIDIDLLIKPSQFYKVISKDNETKIEMRKFSSSSSEIIKTLNPETIVTAISEDENWIKVIDGTEIGFVNKKYLTMPRNIMSANLYKVSEKQSYGEEKVYSINVRSKASKDSNQIGTLLNDEYVEVISQVGDWYKIKYENEEGYVHSSYLSKATGKYIVTAAYGAKMRKKPIAKDDTEIKTIRRNSIVNVEYIDNGWAYSNDGTTSGYINLNFLTPNTTLYEVNNANGIDINKIDSSDSKVIGKLKDKYVVDVISQNKYWSKIRYNDGVGFVKTNSLTKLIIDRKKEDNITGIYYVNVKKTMPIMDSTDINANKIFELNNDVAVNIDKKNLYFAEAEIWINISDNKGVNGWCKVEDFDLIEDVDFKQDKYYAANKYKHDKYSAKKDLIVRKEVGIDKESTGTLKKGTIVTVNAAKKTQPKIWVKIEYEKNKFGWCNYENLSKVKSTASEEEKLNAMMKIAKEQLGKGYEFGSIGVDTFDCSGFTKFVFSKGARVKLSRFSYTQANEELDEILYWNMEKDDMSQYSLNEEELSEDDEGIKQIENKTNIVYNDDLSKVEYKFGDLLFFHTSDQRKKGINHVAMYIGNGKYIHSPTENDVVRINNINDAYYTERIVKIVRVLD